MKITIVVTVQLAKGQTYTEVVTKTGDLYWKSGYALSAMTVSEDSVLMAFQPRQSKVELPATG